MNLRGSSTGTDRLARTRRRRFRGVGVVALLLAAATACHDDDAPGETGSPSAKAGHVRGRVTDESGKPLPDVSVLVRGTTTGASADARTDEDGTYDVEVPDAQYVVYAWKDVEYAGENYRLGLHPADGDWRSGDSSNGLVRDFVWKISGQTPRALDRKSSGSYYGGSLLLSGLVPTQFRPSPDVYELNYPAGSTVEVSLAPSGPRIDGSAARPLTFRRTYQGGVGFSRGDAGEEDFLDIPIGTYTVTATITEPGGASYPGRVAIEHLGEIASGFAPSARFTVPPARGFAVMSPYQGRQVEDVTLYVLR